MKLHIPFKLFAALMACLMHTSFATSDDNLTDNSTEDSQVEANQSSDTSDSDLQSLDDAWNDHEDGDTYTMTGDYTGALSSESDASRLTDTFTIDGTENHYVVYSYNESNSAARMLYVEATGDLTVNNVYFLCGEVEKDQIGHQFILNQGTLSVSDCLFDNLGYETSEVLVGGAICNEGGVIDSIDNCVFQNFSSPSQLAGAMGNIQGGYINSITSCSFIDNYGYVGGAIYNSTADSIGSHSGLTYGQIELIDGTVFSGNSARQGGAIYNAHIINEISNCTFEYNSATQYGGALMLLTTSGLTLTEDDYLHINNSTFTSNTALDYYGGAIYSAVTLYVNGSTFTSNVAQYGGAMVIFDSCYITDSSFIDNYATYEGGAIYNASTLSIRAEGSDVLFEGNTVGSGADQAIYNGGSLHLYASAGQSVIFNDAIISLSEDGGIITINADGSTGSIVLNADMSEVTGSTSFYQGSISVGADMGTGDDGYTNFLGGSFVVDSADYSDAALLDAANAVLDNFDTSQWVTSTELSVGIDVSIDTASADFFDLTGDSLDINITELNILDEALVTDILIAVSDAAEGFSLAEDQYEIVTDNYTYSIEDVYIDGDYFLKISSTANIPEPSTATLSLLALTALLARRRRQAVV